MRRTTMGLTLLFLVDLLAWLPAAAAAQGPRADPDLPRLLELSARPLATVRYTPGSLERASGVQERLVALAAELSGLIDVRTPLLAYVLSREEWEAAGFQRPFGLPEVTASGALALPAAADAEAVALWRRLLAGGLPAASERAVIGSPQELGAQTAADAVGLAELARVLVERRAPAVDAPWGAELAAHLLARLAWERYHPGDLAAVDEVAASLVMAGGGDGARPGSAWRVDAPLSERFWFAGQLARGAAALRTDLNAFACRRLLAGALKKGKPFSAAALAAKEPAFAGWLAVGFAAPGS